LRLSTAVRVDLHERTALARRVVAFDDPDFLPLGEVAEWGEVLPDWYDDWVLDAHDTFHRLRVEALECACAGFTARGQYARAVDSGLAAIAGEPLRESAHRVLMCAYLAEGNPGEALREYNLYRDLLKTELGLEPSPTMVALSTTVRRS
jgi:DNA-binding SARP family transcriptional activator